MSKTIIGGKGLPGSPSNKFIKCCACSNHYNFIDNIFLSYKGKILICPVCGLKHLVTITLFYGQKDSLVKLEELNLADDWRSPTNYIDYSGQWFNEPNAYDKDTGTQTYDSNVPAGQWSAWLGLTILTLPCDKIRFWAPHSPSHQSSAQVEVYYGGDWHSIHDGSYSNISWQEAVLDGTHEISNIRIRFYNSHYTLAGIYLNEFYFNSAPPPPPKDSARTGIYLFKTLKA